MFISWKFILELSQFVHGFLTLSFIIKVKLLQQILIFGDLVLQKRNVLDCVLLDYIVVPHERDEVLFRITGSHTIWIRDYNNLKI